MWKGNILFKLVSSCFDLKTYNSKLFNSKKTISPVVTIALLLVVAVVAVLGFQGWFQSYQSSMISEIEQKGLSDNFNVQTMIDGIVYLSGSAEVISVTVNGNNCHLSGLTDSGMNSLPIADCADSGVNEIVIVTNQGVHSQKLLLEDYEYSNPCPEGYILVPGNIEFGTKNFCVMKYEAKEDSSGLCPTGKTPNCPVSQASGTPWVSITWQDAKEECESLGSGYKLITDEQWLTIANNVAMQAENWQGGVVGTNFMYSGHNDNDPPNFLTASTDDDYYAGTSNSAPSNQRRILNLSNGEVIWDLAGNVWEWTSKSIPSADRYHGGNQQLMSYHIDDGPGKVATNVPSLMLPPNGWNADQGMGRYFDGFSLSGAYNNIDEPPDNCTDYCSPTAAFFRGGSWTRGADAGAFALLLNHGPSDSRAYIGFSCSYEP